MKKRFLAAALLAAASFTAVFAQDYPIHLQRQLKPGDEFKISVSGRQIQDTTVTMDGAQQPEVKNEISAQLDAVEEVLAVDAKGKETKISLTVGKFTITAPDRKPGEALPAGTVIFCSVVDNKQVYEIKGNPVSALFGNFLDLVVDLSQGEPSKDEGFGTAEKKKKGESWDLNGAVVKKTLESAGGCQFDNITGKATLDDVTGDAMKITVHFTGDAKLPVPEGFSLDQASLDATYKETFPIDPLKYQTGDFEDIAIRFTAHSTTPSGQKVVAKTTMEKTMTRSITPPN